MPGQKVLWLPKFLRDNRPARIGLGVLVSPRGAAQLDNPKDPDRAWAYLGHWEDKARELLRRKEQEAKYGSREVYGVLLSLGPQVADQYLAGDEDQEDLLKAIRQHPESGGLAHLLAYLRDPGPATKKDLLNRYPQDPKHDRLSPTEELQEQKEASLAEFLLSL
jgi:hypothetical protein